MSRSAPQLLGRCGWLAARSLLFFFALCFAQPLFSACSYEGAPDFRGDSLGELKVERSTPEPGQLEVGTSTWIDAFFNVPLAGETIADAADFRLFSGVIESYGRVSMNLLEQRLRFVPNQPLLPRLRYQMFLWGGVRGVNGARLGQSRIFDFTVGTEAGPGLPAPSPAPGGDTIQALWSARCTRCHGSGSENRAHLDLSSRSSAHASLAGVPAMATRRSGG